MNPKKASDESVSVRLGGVEMGGVLSLPPRPAGVVVFAHAGGSGLRSPQDRLLAARLHQAGVGTLLADLITPLEAEKEYRRFDVPLLAERLTGLTVWLANRLEGTGTRVGYLGSASGAAVAMAASVMVGGEVSALVSRGGRPDLIPEVLPEIKAPTLLIAGARDEQTTSLTLRAYGMLRTVKELAVVPGAANLLEEPQAFEKVARLAAGWFWRFLPTGRHEPRAGSGPHNIPDPVGS